MLIGTFPEGYSSGEQLFVYGLTLGVVLLGFLGLRWLKNKLLKKDEPPVDQ